MLLNIFILCGFIALGYWWALQGFFSSLVHLLLVIAAGALALSTWEPLAQMLFPFTGTYTWGVSLLGPFIIYLLVMRLAVDNFARGDVQFHSVVEYTGGAFCGLLTVWLMAGLIVIGIGFLPLPTIMLGCQPLIIDSNGTVQENPGAALWFPYVDSTTTAFYSGLSAGAFTSGTPLRFYQPSLARQAVLFRMGYDPNASTVVTPGSLTIGNCFDADTPVNYLEDSTIHDLEKLIPDELRNAGHRLVAIDTDWTIDPPGSYDGDQMLRVYPTQIRLVTLPDESNDPDQAPTELTAPVGFSVENPSTLQRTFYSIGDDKTYFHSANQKVKVSWVFIIPGDRHAEFLLVRHTRMDLPEIKRNARNDITDAVGYSVNGPIPPPVQAASPASPAPSAPSTPGTRVGRVAGEIATQIMISNDLPEKVSRNSAAALDVRGQGVVSGNATVEVVEGLNPNVTIDHIEFPGEQVGVRVAVAQDKAESFLGAAVAAAASLNPVYLQNDTGDKYFVVGYALDRVAEKELVIHVDLTSPLSSAREIPARDMHQGDTLFLYFAVPKGTKVTQFHIGENTYQDVSVTVPQ